MSESYFQFTEREAEEGRLEQRQQVEDRFREYRTPGQIRDGLWEEYEDAMNKQPPDIAYADEMLAAMNEAQNETRNT